MMKTYLQGIGDVIGTPIGKCKVGDVLVYNYGHKAPIEGIERISKHFVIIMTRGTDGRLYRSKRIKTSTLVAVWPGCYKGMSEYNDQHYLPSR